MMWPPMLRPTKPKPPDYILMTRDNLLIIGPYLLWAILWAVMAAVVPALEISEPRYLTASWEMHVRGDYILPTLNFEPYHHKPPLLMWLINGSWAIFGYNVWAARVVMGGIMLALLWVTRHLARALWPQNSDVGLYAPFVLLLSPIMLTYGGQIMFDTLITLIATCALIVVWRQAHGPTWPNTILLGLLLALGGLAKGPMILLFVLPALLLIPVWRISADRSYTWAKWYGMALAAILLGVGGALLWAIPAAIRGGPDYAEMIFWGQSAGRVVKSFAHQKPFWFYLPIMAAYIAPLLLWPSFWRGVWQARLHDSALRFLLISIGIPFLIFSVISGKQTHYIMPLFPAVVVLLTCLILRVRSARPGFIWGVVAVPLLLFAAVPVIGSLQPMGLVNLHDNTALTILETYSLPLMCGAGVLCLLCGYLVRAHGPDRQIPVMAIVMVLLITVSLLQFARSSNRLFDLQPVANALQAHKDHPIGFQSLYRGQIGFLAKMTKPVSNVRDADMDKWFAQNPDGVLVQRVRNEDWHPGLYRVLFDMPYRSSDRMVIISR